MTADDENDAGGRASPGPARALGSAIIGTLAVIGLDVLLGERGDLFASLSAPLHVVGFACTIALYLGPALWWSDRALSARSALGRLVAVLPWLPALGYAVSAGFEGGQARRFLAGGLGPLIATLLAALLLALALDSFRLLRRKSRLLGVAAALAGAFGLHLIDRRFWVGLYPIQHALCGFLAFAAAGFAFLGPGGGSRSSSRRALVVVLLVGAGAAFHLLGLHRGPMPVRALLLANDGLVSTREFDRVLPYRRAEASEPLGAGFSARHEAELERRSGARARLAELRPEGPLDLIVLSIDAVRADHTSLHGFARDTTPFLAEFAAECIVFEGARSPSTASFFSISSMLSGAYPSTVSLLKGRDPEYIGEALQREGYATIGYYTDAVFTARPREWSAPDQRLGFSNFKIATVESAEMIPLLLDQIDRQTGPYLLFTHFMDPHFSYEKHEGFDFGDEAVDRYHSELAFVDAQLRRFVGELRARGRLERTVLVITSDHGEAFGEHGALLHGGVPHEEQCRVPLLIRAPFLEGGRRIEGAVSLASLVPTLIDLLGLTDPRDSEARSLAPMIVDEIDPATSIAVIERPTLFDKATWPATTALVRGRWKLLHDHDAAVAQLFDLQEDPGESRDLAARRPEILAELLRLEAEMRSDRRLLRAHGAELPLDLLAARDRLREGDADALAPVRPFLDHDSALVRREAGIAVHDAVRGGLAELAVLRAAANRRQDPVLLGLADLIEAERAARPWREGAGLLRAEDPRLRRRASATLWRLRREAWALAHARARLADEGDAEVRADLLGVVLEGEDRDDDLGAAVALIGRLDGDSIARLAYSLMSLDDARLGPRLDELIANPDARVAASIIDSLGARDNELRRARMVALLRMRSGTLKRIAVLGLGKFPRSEWKKRVLIDLVRREPHDEVRFLAGLELADFPGPEVGEAFLDALAVHPVTGLGFGHLLITGRPEQLANWSLREDEKSAALASGAEFELAPDLDRPWGGRMRRLLVSVLRDPALVEAGDLIRVHDADGRLMFEQRHLEQAAMYYADLPLHGPDAGRPPFRLSVESESREAGAVFGQLFATLIPFHEPIEYWPADMANSEEVGILSRFDAGWDCDLDHPDRVFLITEAGVMRMKCPEGAPGTLEIALVGAARDCELELLLNGVTLGRYQLAAGRDRRIVIADLRDALDGRNQVVLEFKVPELAGLADSAGLPATGLGLKEVHWR